MIRRCKGVIPVKVTEIPGKLLAIDICDTGVPVCIITVYALNIPKERKSFFQQIFTLTTDNTILLGDFNSVELDIDCFSGHLDDTSTLLSQLIRSHNFSEIPGSHHFSFTYHHPSVATHKSHLDCIYTNFSIPTAHGYSQYVSFSDHYLVGMYILPDKDIGPKLW